MTALATLAMVNIDAADPEVLAAFYHQVLGWDVTHSERDYAMISDGTTAVGFGRVEGYRAPQWPDAGKQFHLDFHVGDLAEAEARCLELGAAKPEFQPGGDRWTVLTDPSGHPFCICLKS
ncbi:VOC family protein [Solihabitans fulvus]|uniref:VOC family protein n=1 Tax=Solihabitans fulvus TaxID=1892852 RepID=A0A5B2WLE2_9PSEU|nr:VOC family protein [Solihabitans fulvus]KAA2251366.1 VOC family protein [Solihabitans fulvus]